MWPALALVLLMAAVFHWGAGDAQAEIGAMERDVAGRLAGIESVSAQTPTLEVSPSGPLTVTEGSSNTYVVSLSGVPSGRVVVQPEFTAAAGFSSDGRAVVMEPTALVFTRTDYGGKTVRVHVSENDSDDEAVPNAGSINHRLFGALTVVVSNPALQVAVNDDDDVADVDLPATVSVTEGDSFAYLVSLKSDPGEGKTVTVGLPGPVPGAVSYVGGPSSLAFTSANWRIPQAFVVNGVRDEVDGSNRVVDVTHTVSASGTNGYDGLTLSPVRITVVDDDASGVVFAPEGLVLAEGESATYTVRLNSKPSDGDVTVKLSAGGALAKAFKTGSDSESASLTFTAADWEAPQPVTVQAVSDSGLNGWRLGTVEHALSGGGYSGSHTLNVTVASANRPSSPLRFFGGLPFLPVHEPGGGATKPNSGIYTVQLFERPSGHVFVDLMVSDTAVAGLSRSRLTFTAGDWNTAQQVVVTGLNDGAGLRRARFAQISHRVSGAVTEANAGYVNVRVPDDDPPVGDPAVTFAAAAGASLACSGSPLDCNVGEGGAFSYRVKLASKPSGPVVLNVDSSNPVAVVASPTALRFTAGNWNVYQSVQVRSINDGVAGPAASAVLTHRVSGGGYDAVSADAVTVSVDGVNGSGSVEFDGVPLLLTEGGSGRYGVRLDTKPAGPVTVYLEQPVDAGFSGGSSSSEHVPQFKLTPAQLTFTPDNYSVYQHIGVETFNDDAANGSRTFSIGHHVGGSGYSVDGVDVRLLVVDDDSIRVRLSSTTMFLEPGGSGSYQLRLTEAPSGGSETVSLSVSPVTSDGVAGDLSLTPATALQFNDNWSTDQTVTVTAGSGAAGDYNIVHTVDGDVVAYVFVRVSAASGSAGVSIFPATAVVVPGYPRDYRVRLTEQPSGSVVITAIVDDPNVATVSGSPLTFNVDNWNVPQSLTLSGVASGNTVVRHVANGGGYDQQTVGLVNVAVESAPESSLVRISKSRLDLEHGGSTNAATYKVFLTSEPNVDVVVPIAIEPVAVVATVSPAGNITLTSSNWEDGVEVTVTAVGAGLAQVTHGAGAPVLDVRVSLSVALPGFTMSAGRDDPPVVPRWGYFGDYVGYFHDKDVDGAPTLAGGRVWIYRVVPDGDDAPSSCDTESGQVVQIYALDSAGGEINIADDGTHLVSRALFDEGINYVCLMDSTGTGRWHKPLQFRVVEPPDTYRVWFQNVSIQYDVGSLPSLSVTDVTDTTARLVVHREDRGSWYYKADVGPHTSCSSVQLGETAVLTGLTAGTKYTYTAYSDSTCSTEIASETWTASSAPLAPVSVQAYLGDKQVRLHWVTASVGASPAGWEYRQKTVAGSDCSGGTYGSWQDISNDRTQRAHTITGLNNASTKYCFQVRAKPDGAASADAGPADPEGVDSDVTLRVENIGRTDARLRLSEDVGSWWYDATYGPDTSCRQAFAGWWNHVWNLDAGTTYTYRAYSKAGCDPADRIGEAEFSTRVAGGVVLRVGSHSVTDSRAVLTISGHAADWWYKTDPSTNPDAACTSVPVPSGTSDATLSGLTSGTTYTYKAYSGGGCADDDKIADVTFTTDPAPSVGLTASRVAETTATLTISNHSGSWYYKGVQSGDSCSSEVAAGTSTANLAGLSKGEFYIYKAYSDSGCTTELTNDATHAEFTALALLDQSSFLVTNGKQSLGDKPWELPQLRKDGADGHVVLTHGDLRHCKQPSPVHPDGDLGCEWELVSGGGPLDADKPWRLGTKRAVLGDGLVQVPGDDMTFRVECPRMSSQGECGPFSIFYGAVDIWRLGAEAGDADFAIHREHISTLERHRVDDTLIRDGRGYFEFTIPRHGSSNYRGKTFVSLVDCNQDVLADFTNDEALNYKRALADCTVPTVGGIDFDASMGRFGVGGVDMAEYLQEAWNQHDPLTGRVLSCRVYSTVSRTRTYASRQDTNPIVSYSWEHFVDCHNDSYARPRVDQVRDCDDALRVVPRLIDSPDLTAGQSWELVADERATGDEGDGSGEVVHEVEVVHYNGVCGHGPPRPFRHRLGDFTPVSDAGPWGTAAYNAARSFYGFVVDWQLGYGGPSSENGYDPYLLTYQPSRCEHLVTLGDTDVSSDPSCPNTVQRRVPVGTSRWSDADSRTLEVPDGQDEVSLAFLAPASDVRYPARRGWYLGLPMHFAVYVSGMPAEHDFEDDDSDESQWRRVWLGSWDFGDDRGLRHGDGHHRRPMGVAFPLNEDSGASYLPPTVGDMQASWDLTIRREYADRHGRVYLYVVPCLPWFVSDSPDSPSLCINLSEDNRLAGRNRVINFVDGGRSGRYGFDDVGADNDIRYSRRFVLQFGDIAPGAVDDRPVSIPRRKIPSGEGECSVERGSSGEGVWSEALTWVGGCDADHLNPVPVIFKNASTDQDAQVFLVYATGGRSDGLDLALMRRAGSIDESPEQLARMGLLERVATTARGSAVGESVVRVTPDMADVNGEVWLLAYKCAGTVSNPICSSVSRTGKDGAGNDLPYAVFDLWQPPAFAVRVKYLGTGDNAIRHSALGPVCQGSNCSPRSPVLRESLPDGSNACMVQAVDDDVDDLTYWPDRVVAGGHCSQENFEPIPFSVQNDTDYSRTLALYATGGYDPALSAIQAERGASAGGDGDDAAAVSVPVGALGLRKKELTIPAGGIGGMSLPSGMADDAGDVWVLGYDCPDSDCPTPLSSGTPGVYSIDHRPLFQVRASFAPPPTMIITPRELSVREGASASYTVRLGTVPSGTVNVALSVAPEGAAAIADGVTALTFTPENWRDEQTVTVTVADNDNVGDYTVRVLHTVTGANYGGQVCSDRCPVVISVDDDDAYGATVSHDTLIINEGTASEPGTGEYTVVLRARPTGVVTVTLTAERWDDDSVSPERVVTTLRTLSFNPLNWNVPQTVTVTAVYDDQYHVPSRAVRIRHAFSGGGYDAAVSVPAVNVTVVDAQFPSVGITGSDGVVIPGNRVVMRVGETRDYELSLGSKPAQPVTMSLSTTPGRRGQRVA